MARLTPEECAAEAARWLKDETPKECIDIPPDENTVLVSLRISTQMAQILNEFATREKIGAKVLIRRWLYDRVRTEAEAVLKKLKGK